MVNLIQDSPQTHSESSEAAKFTFTELADTANNFTSFSSIALNNNGVVAFSGGKDASGITGIYTSDGNAITTIADINTLDTLFTDTQLPGETSRTNSFDGDVAINNTGSVLFDARVSISGMGFGSSTVSRLYLNTNDTLNQVAQTTDFMSGNIGSSTRYTGLGINDSGQIVYSTDTLTITPRQFENIAIVVDGKTIARGFSGPGAPTVRVYNPVINNQGTVFYGQLGSVFNANGGVVDASNIFRLGSEDTTPVAVADQRLTVQSLAANDQGTIVFSGSLASGETGLFLIDNGVITEVNNQFGNAKVNNQGTIAFQPSQTPTTPTGIFTTSDGVLEKVIAPGDSLLDSTVADVQFGGLNDAGQVAFVAELTDGTKGIFRADPLHDQSSDKCDDIIYLGANNDPICAGYGNGNIFSPIDVGFGNDLPAPLQNPPLSSVGTV